MLLELRDFIQKYHEVSHQQLLREFSLAESALMPMLSLWERKGVIARMTANTACAKKCTGCSSRIPIFYRYLA